MQDGMFEPSAISAQTHCHYLNSITKLVSNLANFILNLLVSQKISCEVKKYSWQHAAMLPDFLKAWLEASVERLCHTTEISGAQFN
jgi:hypothetical protein